mmetsp:Transcript_29346/g.74400  ORF Transcript_29346/g.74400 Transcript_29346/m.74400 type:complete len:267 (-) Transcript_29346:365-1165(-)
MPLVVFTEMRTCSRNAPSSPRGWVLEEPFFTAIYISAEAILAKYSTPFQTDPLSRCTHRDASAASYRYYCTGRPAYLLSSKVPKLDVPLVRLGCLLQCKGAQQQLHFAHVRVDAKLGGDVRNDPDVERHVPVPARAPRVEVPPQPVLDAQHLQVRILADELKAPRQVRHVFKDDGLPAHIHQAAHVAAVASDHLFRCPPDAFDGGPPHAPNPPILVCDPDLLPALKRRLLLKAVPEPLELEHAVAERRQLHYVPPQDLGEQPRLKE